MGGRLEARTRLSEDSVDHLDGGRIVDHFRVDTSRELFTGLAIGAVLMTLGSFVIGAALAADLRAGGHALGLAHEAALTSGVPGRGPLGLAMIGLGLLLIAIGGGGAILRLNRGLRDERYLALRTDGAYLRLGERRELLCWEDTEAVRFEPGRGVVFTQHDGEEWVVAERFGGLDGPALARRAAEVRRKALFGLL
ncbi:MAG: hypothetical protein AB7S26_02900 [Sandaracinaceae bacterium]